MKKLFTVFLALSLVAFTSESNAQGKKSSANDVRRIVTDSGDELFQASSFRPVTNLQTKITPRSGRSTESAGQIYLAEGFESWSTGWGAPTGWAFYPAANGNNAWHRNDFTTGWSSITGAYSPVSLMGGHAARFHTYDASSGQQGAMTTPVMDLSGATGNVYLSFWWTNGSGTDTLFVDYSNNGFTDSTNLGFVVVTGGPWYQVTAQIPAPTATTQIRFRAKSDYGASDIGLDEVIVYEAGPAYSGTLTLPGTFTNFTDAARKLSIFGVSGATTINVTSGSYEDSVTFTPIPGASATNTITFVNNGGPVTVSRRGAINHGTTVGSWAKRTDDAVISLWGADYMTFDGIGITFSGPTVADTSLEWGYYVRALTPTDGANYNTFKGSTIVMNRLHASTRGIFHWPFWVLTSQAGASSYNKYYNNDIQNCGFQGILLRGQSGSTSFPDMNNEIASVGGGTARIFNIGGSSGSANAISMSGQNGAKVYGLLIDSIWATSGAVNAVLLGTGTTAGDSNVNIEIYNNTIKRLVQTAGSASSILTAIRIPGTANNIRAKIYNNIIYDLRSNGTSANAIDALYHQANTSAGTIVEYYYNTVLLSNQNIGSGGGSQVWRIDNQGAIIRNNIFVNTSAVNGASANYIYNRTGSATLIASNNALYIDTTTAGRSIGFYGSAQKSLPAWQAASGQDAQTVYENPPFLDAGGPSLAANLHLNTSTATQLESGGTPIAGITTDFDGDVRNDTTPDIGMDEGAFTMLDLTGPAVNYTAFINTTSTSNRTLSNVTITDVSGVAGDPNRPRLYYKKSTDVSWVSVAATGTTSPYSFTTDYTLVGGGSVSAGDVIQYFVIAQDVPGNITANPGTGLVATNVNTITTYPTNPNSYTIASAYSGAYNVGTGAATYTTLKSFFDAVNGGVVTGNITANIIGNCDETATAALNQWAEEPAGSNYTMTIVPNGAAYVVSGTIAGPLVNLNGADRVTINGDITGTKSLTFRNANTSNPTFQFINDATNNTITNCFIEGANTGTASGTIVFSTTSGTTGNDNNTISYCDIKDATGVPANAIYASGTGSGATANSNNAITYNRIYNWTATGITLTGTGTGDAWNVFNNSLYQTASRSTVLTAISVLGGNGQVINTNYIGGGDALCGGSALTVTNSFTGINLTVGTVTNTTVQNNAIQNISVGAGAYSFIGIQGTAGNIDIISNTIGHTSTAGSITTAGTSLQRGIGYSGSNTVMINSNLIANISATGTTGTVGTRLIEVTGGTASIKWNTLRDAFGTGVSTWSDYDAAIHGIELRSALANQLVEGNEIYNLTAANTGTANTTAQAIRVTSGTGVVTRNEVYNIVNNSTGTTANIFGIHFPGGIWLVTNNMVNLGTDVTGNFIINGIRSNTSSIERYYNNTVNIAGTVTSGSNASYAFTRMTSGADTLRNNIFSNTRTGGTGKHFAFGNTTATNWSAVTSDYNVFHTANPDSLAQWLTLTTNLADWKTNSGGDANTFAGDPGFIGGTDLHISAGSGIPSNNGIALPGIVDVDIDGDARSATTPDRGADEYVGAAPVAFALSTPANWATEQPINGTLTWEASTYATSYDVFIDIWDGSNTPTTLLDNVTGTSISYSVTPIDTFIWRVVAKNGNGTTNCTSDFVFATGANPPAAPTALTFDAITIDTVVMSWTDNATDEGGFRVYRSTDLNGTFTNVSGDLDSIPGSGSTGNYIDGGLSSNTKYYYKVVSFDAVSGNSEAALDSAVTLANIPGTPILSDAGVVTMKVTIDPNGNPDWTEYSIRVTTPLEAIDDYVQADGSIGSTRVWQSYTAWGGANGITVKGLTPATAYTFDMTARNLDGEVTEYSATAELTTTTTVYPITEGFEGTTFPPTGWAVQDLNAGNTWIRSTGGPHTGVASAAYPYHGTLPANDWLFSPALVMDSGAVYKITYWYKAHSATFTENMKVAIGLDQIADSMTTMLADHPGIASTTYLTNTIEYVAPASGVYFVGFHCYSIADRWNLYLDDITISPVYAVDYGITGISMVDGIPPVMLKTAGNDIVNKVDGEMLNMQKGVERSDVNNSRILSTGKAYQGMLKAVANDKNLTVLNTLATEDTRDITMRFTVANFGIDTTKTFELAWDVAGTPQTGYTSTTGITNDGSVEVDLGGNYSELGTHTTNATLTVADDENLTNNDLSFFRTLVYPDTMFRIQYDNGTNVQSTFIGANGPPFLAGVRFTASADMQLTNIDGLYRNEASTDSITVQIWAAGATNNVPGALLYAKNFGGENYISAAGDYITIPLGDEAPVFASGTDFWVSIGFANVPYPMGAHNTGFTPGRSFYSMDAGATWNPLVITTERAWLMRVVGVPYYINHPPAAFNLLTPADETFITVDATSADTALITWTPAIDPNGDPVSYYFMASLNELFTDSIVVAVGADTSFKLAYSDIDAVLANWGVADGDTADIYWKVIASDGTSETNSDSFILTAHRLIDIGVDDGNIKPTEFALYQNYPNPFNPTTTIKYDIKDAGKVSLKIYNLLGQEVRTLVNSTQNIGKYSVVWDGKNNAGLQVSTGLYIYRIQAGNFVKSHKMMLLK